uniref:Uncharacterized protein n=1 Tax=Salix viminalis TaxID=40686 RepID=A0A6N2M447_SALVM
MHDRARHSKHETAMKLPLFVLECPASNRHLIVPSSSGITPPDPVKSRSNRESKGIQRLSCERDPQDPKNLEQIVRANHQLKQASLRNPVFLVPLASQFGEETMVVEVTTDSYQKQHEPWIHQINGWLC